MALMYTPIAHERTRHLIQRVDELEHEVQIYRETIERMDGYARRINSAIQEPSSYTKACAREICRVAREMKVEAW